MAHDGAAANPYDEPTCSQELGRLRKVLDNINEGFCYLDPEFRVVELNAEALRLEQRPADAIIGRTHWEAWPGSEETELGQLYKRAMAERIMVSVEHRFEWPDGRYAWLDLRGYPDEDGLALFFRDVTERKLTELALAAQAAEREAILGQLAEGVIVADAEGRITFVNEAAERLHGVRLLGVEPDDYAETYHLLTEDGRPHPPRDLPLARAILDGATVKDARWRIRRPDGSEVLAIGSARPIMAANGTRLGAALTVRDDTQRARAEMELRDLNAELERRVEEEVLKRMKAEESLVQAQKIEALGQLTGGVAHDFNNLLGAVIGNLDLLSRKLGDERLRRYVDGAIAGAQRGAQLTRQLLAFARRQRLVPQAVDVNALAEGAVQHLLRRTLGGLIEVQLLPAEDLWSAMIDPVQLESAILNLAINARDAMPEGGALILETSNVRIGPGIHADLVPGDYVLLAVTDTGMGMSQDVAARATEPFFTTKDVGKGTGLGLSTVYGFLRQSGGAMRITSHPGEGTTVQLYIPRSPVSPDRAPDTSLLQERHGTGRIVLVVDDDDDIRATTLELLNELGYAVVAAPTGTQALEILRTNPEIGMVVTDYAMPGLNGAEFLRQARTMRPNLLALVATGYAQDAELDRSLEGATMIRKPFTLSDLAIALQSLG